MKHRKIIFLFIVMVLVSSLSLPMLYAARRGEGSKIGVFDMQRIIRDSKAGQKARATFEKGLQERRDIIVKREQDLRKFQQAIVGNQGLDTAELEAKKKEFAKELKELKRLRTDLEEEMKDMDKGLTIELLKDVAKIVKEIGQDNDFSVIFQKSANMVYVADAADITADVIKKYDKQVKR